MKEKKTEQKEQPDAAVSEQSKAQSDPLAEMTDLLKRTQANFENYRKQTEKRIEDIKQTAAQNLIVQILPIIDNFELALKEGNKNHQDFVKGIELIYSQLFSILEQNGVQPIQTEHQQYDPYGHEALLKVPSDLPENSILEEFQKGFLLHNKVIRHAKVKISAGRTESFRAEGTTIPSCAGKREENSTQRTKGNNEIKNNKSETKHTQNGGQ